MLVRKKTTKDEAQSERKKLVALFKNQSRELRTALAKAKLSKSYQVLKYKSFEAYLKDIILRAHIDMKTDYARKCANAGIVELTILGEDLIGTMREAVLRIFYENIPKSYWKKVFELAKKNSRKPSMYRLLTSKQIIEAAISLEVYKKVETKSKENLKEKNTATKTNNKPLLLNGDKGNGNKTFSNGINNISNVESDNKVSTSNPSNAKVVSIKSLTSDKASEHIVSKYQANDIKNILGFLRVSQNENIQGSCNYILAHCKEGAIKNTINKLSRHLQVVKKKPKRKAG
jgi:hypothetical protein